MAENTGKLSIAGIRMEEASGAQDFPFDPLAITKSKYIFPFLEYKPNELYRGVALANIDLTTPHYPRAQITYPYNLEHDPTVSALGGPCQQGSSQSFLAAEPPMEHPSVKVPQKVTIEEVRSLQYLHKVYNTMGDPYDEELAELKFMQSQPATFMVIGKPSIDNLKLAQKIADYWGCICIDPESSLKKMLTETQVSAWCLAKLRRGQSIPSNLMMRLMEHRVLSDEVAYRGYVLCGLPFVPEDEEDPSVQEQLDMVLSWQLKPQVFIYIMCSDSDVITKNDNIYFDYTSGNYINRNVYHLDKKVRVVFTHDKRAVVNEDVTNKLYSEIEQEKSLVDQSAVKHLVHIPQSSYSVTYYSDIAMRDLEHYMSQLDPQYIIRVDGRTTPVHMMKIVQARLDALPLRRMYIPQRMTEAHPAKPVLEDDLNEEEVDPEEAEYIEEIEDIEEDPIESPEDKFPALSIDNCPGPKYKWRLSHWGYLCPVALQSGLNVQGTSNNVVRFLDKLYFLSSPEATDKFISNPQRYLLPPNPQPTCKFYIVGPPYSYKSVLSQYLACMFNGKVISIQKVFDQHLEARHSVPLAEIRLAAAKATKEQLENERRKKWEEMETERIQAVQDWKNNQVALLKAMEEHNKKEGVTSISTDKTKYQDEDSIVDLEDSAVMFPSDSSIHYPEGITAQQSCWLLQNPDELMRFLPPELAEPIFEPPPVSDKNPHVVQSVQKAVQNFKDQQEPLGVEEKATALKGAIFEIQSARMIHSGGHLREGGWVVDGMPLEVELWQQLEDVGLLPEEVICLRDHDLEFSYLVSKFKTHPMDTIDSFRLLYPGFTSKASLMNLLYLESSSEDMIQERMEFSSSFFLEESVSEMTPNLSVDKRDLSSSTVVTGPQEEQYIQDLEKFEEDWRTFQDSYNIKPAPMEVDVNNKNIHNLITEIFKKVEARYRLAVEPLSEEALEEEMDSAAESTVESIMEEEKAVTQNGQLIGDTAHFCPVVFHTKGILWPGKDTLTLKFHNKIYTFSSEDALDNFTQRPWEFAPNRNPVDHFPPVRICIVGPIGSGKTSIASKIAFQLGMLHRDFLNDIDTILTKDGMQKVGRKHEDPTDSFGNAEPQEESTEELPDEDNPSYVLHQYLKEGMPVPDKLLPNVLAPLWESEPYISRGFIYSGFPLHPQDFDIMKRNCLIPDVIVQLNLEDSNIVESRVLQEYIDLWKARQNMKKKDVNTREKKIKNEWKEAIAKRKQELLREYHEGIVTPVLDDIIAASILHNLPLVSDIIEEDTESHAPSLTSESQILNDINDTLLVELPQPEREHHDWETVSQARTRLTQELQEWLDTDIESLETLKTLAEEENIPWLDVNAANSIDDVCNEVLHHIAKYKQRSASLFEKTYILSVDQAERLLQSGYLFLSKFARWCPVQIDKKEVPFLMFTPLKKTGDIYPVAHRRYIYFLAGKENMDLFVQHPLKYTQQDMDQPLVPVKIAVVGPPKSGKTTLCERLSNLLGLKVITAGQSVRYVLDELGWSELAINMQLHLQQGVTLPTQLIVQCVEAATIDPRCVTQGFILDGFPNKVQHMKELNKASLVPYLIIVLDCSLSVSIEHLQSEMHTIFSRAPLFPPELLRHKYGVWQEAAQEGLQWAQQQYQNVIHLDGEHMVWWVSEHAKEHIFQVVDSVATYFRNIDKDLAAQLDCMCITQQEFETHQSQYHNYCPVCLKQGHLTNGDLPPSKQGLVQYLDHYYWLCKQHLTAFLMKAQAFVPPINKATLPEHIATIVKPNELNMQQVAKGGYCIVTYCENLPQRRLVKGLPNYAVRYKEQVFLFANRLYQDRFLEEPETYYGRDILNIERTLPPLQTVNLPCMGFLEQTASMLIHKAVSAVGSVRPKYPGLSSNVSAAVHIGYYLKTLNPNISWTQKCRFEEARQLFLARCQTLEKMYQASRIHNPFRKYAGAEEPC